jgi:hypothetical protein
LDASNVIETKDLVMNIWYCKNHNSAIFHVFPQAHTHSLVDPYCPTFHILMAWHYITTLHEVLLCRVIIEEQGVPEVSAHMRQSQGLVTSRTLLLWGCYQE